MQRGAACPSGVFQEQGKGEMKRHLIMILMVGAGVFLSIQGLHAKTWEYQKSGVLFNLTAVSFVDREYGWAVGQAGVILGTSDGGATWRDLVGAALNPAPYDLGYPWRCDFRSVHFLDRKQGWVAGEVNLPVMNPESVAPFPVSFGVVFHTEDGGRTWKCQYPYRLWTDSDGKLQPRVPRINDIFFLNERQGWAVGEGFYYLVTEDGGATWKEMPMGFFAIPEIRHALTATHWISTLQGWVSGYWYDMFYPERRGGFIARTEDGGDSWKMDPFYPPTFAPVQGLMDLEVTSTSVCPDASCLRGWSVGEQGGIFHLTAKGWESQSFPWPLSLPLPHFNAVTFSDRTHGWIVGYRSSGFIEDAGSLPREVMTIFQTTDGGETWGPFPWAEPGRLNDVDAVGGTDAWAVGDGGVILHYGNHEPEICRLWTEPYSVYAGRTVGLFASVKDLDGPGDIARVSVDARSIGGGTVDLEPAWESPDALRCVLYQGKARVSPLAGYGSHVLPLEVVDVDGAVAAGEIELFVITSWVEIERTWAMPNPVISGGKVLLAAEVGIVAPKTTDGEPILRPYNKVEKVTVDISQLLGVDCTSNTDCIAVVEMTDPDGDGIYTYGVAPVTAAPGKYVLTVWAVDTLGHRDKAEIYLRVFDIVVCLFDADHDGDVDGKDLAAYAGYFFSEGMDASVIGDLALEFNRTLCAAFPRIGEYADSGCLPQSRLNLEADQYPFCGDDEIEFILEGGTVRMVHTNATYNCCPEDIVVSMSVEGDVIAVTEKEIGGFCHCLCCYDVKSTIVDLPPGEYVISYSWYDYETGEVKTKEEVVNIR